MRTKVMCSVIFTLWSAVAMRGGTPGRPTGFVLAPSSMDELLACCKTAAYVEVLQRDIVQRQTRLDLEDFAQVQVRVIRPLKGDVVAGQTITFLEHLYNNDTVSAPPTDANTAADDLQPSGRYIVFLNWNDALASRVAYNRESIFRVINDRVLPLGRSAFAQSQRNRSWSSFEADVRERVAKERRVR